VAGGVIAILSAGISYSRFSEQYRCKRWAERGEHQTAQGEISGWHRSKGHCGFTVAGVPFVYHAESAGFRGEFTTANVPTELLRDGQVVRIAYHEGYILRIEIPSPSGEASAHPRGMAAEPLSGQDESGPPHISQAMTAVTLHHQ
jgi:hypothetical protein